MSNKLMTHKKSRFNKESLPGKVFNTISFGDVKVIEYINSANVRVQFLDSGHIVTARLYELSKGMVRDTIRKRNSVFKNGIGVIGEGPYSVSSHKHIYNVWCALLKRCYDENHRGYAAYQDCEVCLEWQTFQNFAKWYEDNCPENWQIDKDILNHGNRLYSPDTCLCVPKRINQLFVYERSRRGNLPIGVSYADKCPNRPYIARLGNKEGFKKYLGSYPTPTEAFAAYKSAKEKLIKFVANQYHDVLTGKAYSALLAYEVHIDD